MANAPVTFLMGEIGPVTIKVPAPNTETYDIQGTPTCTLYKPDGTTDTLINNTPVTASDSGALPAPTMYYLFSSSGYPPGTYTLSFDVVVLGSDSITRTLLPNCKVIVAAVTTPSA